MSRSAGEGGVVECVCTVHSSVRSFLCPDYCVFLILYNINASTFLYILTFLPIADFVHGDTISVKFYFQANHLRHFCFMAFFENM